MYVERALEKKLNKYLKSKEIIAVVGARQCGKTTLLHHFLSKLNNKELLSFEDQELLNLFTNDIKSFIELYVKGRDYLFIDEFQYAKNGGKQLKYIYDNFKIKIFISGSSAQDLAVQGLKYLVGRVLVFNLYPLNFFEYLKFKDEKLAKLFLDKAISSEIIKKINKHYFEFSRFGGYPRVVLSKTIEEKKEILKNIYNTYLLREIKEILQLADSSKLITLMKALALHSGNRLNYEEVSSSVGISRKELLKYLMILKQTFILFEVKPFFTNKKKELIKASEYFFLDNGFRNLVLNNFQELDSRIDKGLINECFVASELIKKDLEIKFWRTKAKAEVDFILEKEGEIIPIEVKSKLLSDKISRSFRNFLEMYAPKRGFILNYDFLHKKNVHNTSVIFKGLVETSNLF
jgi:uncharacterized protein